MADNLNIPKDLTKVFEIRDTSNVLRTFLIDLATRLQNAEAKIKALETQVETLTNGN